MPAFDATPSASQTVNNTLGFIDWDITDLVESWVNGTYENYGVVIKDNADTALTRKAFISSDYTDNTDFCPKLVVTYTVPGGGFLALL
jgi:hypothetical protein